MIESEGVFLGNNGKRGHGGIFRVIGNWKDLDLQSGLAKIPRQMPDVGSHFGKINPGGNLGFGFYDIIIPQHGGDASRTAAFGSALKAYAVFPAIQKLGFHRINDCVNIKWEDKDYNKDNSIMAAENALYFISVVDPALNHGAENADKKGGIFHLSPGENLNQLKHVENMKYHEIIK
jgi:hypothetical protein